MPTQKIPHTLLIIATGASHVVMIAGAVLLYWAGKIDAATLTAVLVAFGGAYSGAVGALVTAARSSAVTPSASTPGAPSASAASVTHSSATPADPVA